MLTVRENQIIFLGFTNRRVAVENCARMQTLGEADGDRLFWDVVLLVHAG